MLIAFKVLISSLVISLSSWMAGKKPVLAGFIIALPISSLLGILFLYLEQRDMAKVNEYAVSILVAVPLSLVFFLPFVLNRWLKMGFIATLASSLALLAAAYFTHSWLFKNTSL